PFMRFMMLKHRAPAINKIVPKSSLVENATLVEIAAKEFGKKPTHKPNVKIAKLDANGIHTSIVTTMKNEGPFILEWLAYHRIIGVDKFLIYTNDCTDGTDTLLELLDKKGLVQHRDNKFKGTGLKPQHAALQAAQSEPMIVNADWLICMDVDEFIDVKVGDGTLKDLYSHMRDANMISCTWRLFGNADIAEFTDQPIIKMFDQCAPELIRKPHQAWGFKTLFRNTGIFRKLGVHRPKGLNPHLWDQIRWVNGSGQPLPTDMFRNAWRSTSSTYGYDLVSLNHYAVRSAESFLVKRDRGRVNHVDRDQGLSYWFRMNNNSVRDTSIQRMLPQLQDEMARLLADPEIAVAHQHCVAAHRAKIAELRATQKYSEFFETLTSERMRRLSRMHKHFGANVFLSGPDVIPDDVVHTDHPNDFFFSVTRQETSH
ncbi:MAG: glycosyltransferase family 2 protein, partial [Marinosulfonomonas sp.]|nr:glycosyltransferase family 2 protein [Marinosulfonomonas sp.]